MLNQFSRTQLLLGKGAMDRLQQAHVAVFGIGGVGGYVCEALVRSGVGAFDLIEITQKSPEPSRFRGSFCLITGFLCESRP